MQFQEYPKTMIHPNYQAPSASNDYVAGTPQKFPLVIVKNAAEERRQNDRGYICFGRPESDAKAFERNFAAPLPEDYEVEVWPRWVDGVIVDGPEHEAELAAQKERLQYPKWIDGQVVNDKAEERELLKAKAASRDAAPPPPVVEPVEPVAPAALAEPPVQETQAEANVVVKADTKPAIPVPAHKFTPVPRHGRR